MKKRRLSIAAKLYIFISITILVAAAGTALLAYQISANQIDNYYYSIAYENAINFSTQVNGDYLLKLRKCAESKEYQTLREKAEKNDDEAMIQTYLEEQGLWDGYVETRHQLIKYLHNMSSIKYLYIIVCGGQDDLYDMNLIDDDGTPLYQSGYYVEREPEFYGIDASQRIGPTISSGKRGWLCSAYAPIYDFKGNLVAQVGCAISMDKIFAERNQTLLYILATAIGSTILILIIAMYVIRRIVIKPLDSITQEMKKFNPSNSDYESAGVIDLEFKRNDEITELYNGVRSMQINIIDHLNDLEKLQKHKEKAEADIKDLSVEAFLDSLTGVGTKTAYTKKITDLNQHIDGGDTEIALVMIDLNNLKQINDKYGHENGNHFIKGSCRLVCNTFMRSPVYRIGGDEFIVVLQGESFAERFKSVEILKEKFKNASTDIKAEPWERYSASVGMSELTSDDISLEAVFKRADEAMYINKKSWKESHGSYR